MRYNNERNTNIIKVYTHLSPSMPINMVIT